ncbi:protein disulfide-isomerase 2-like [Photinus pyralis]|uniref:protein disulfide-isomerase 2-like n=1 Tax=Photinus pyralis TaxID=7054 RepID=UPI00126764E2|nr:protein disulfide-isomerase 2-like [Photinus pyralis]
MSSLPLCLIGIVLVLPLGSNGNVIKLTESNFNEMTSQNKIMVKFYTTWCSYCKKMAEPYIKLAKELKDTGSDIKVAEVDCEKYSRVCDKAGIKGLPTLQYYRNGSPTEYKGQRTTKPMLQWLTSTA